MKRKITCLDNYEAQKLATMIYIKDGKETFITKILNVVENEIVVLLKDKSAHSILLKDNSQVESFADFIQSVIEQDHKIIETTIIGNEVEIIKE
ncbi:MAG: hypothetical protein NPMRD1_250018 [Nitrosopumilales archaeon]|nr:MAG: hypothetical protein NPMRD1_250018 [Nitrosopumilales archaeon]